MTLSSPKACAADRTVGADHHTTDAMTRTAPATDLHDDAHLRVLRLVREEELSQALAFFPKAGLAGCPSIKVLEVGAGTGQQARELQRAGYSVTAIDLAGSHYRNDRVFPITEYDGRAIPLGDDEIDVVFSSNVLEHVADIDDFLAETIRVMKPGGVAIHILPTSSGRIWSMGAHYLWLAQRTFAKIRAMARINSAAGSDVPKTPANSHQWLATIIPLRHGERGNALTEAWYFSARWWTKKFAAHGFKIEATRGNDLFYTMASVFGDAIGVQTRRRLAKALGSSCRIYVLSR